jgi:uncharacterized protein (DUF169 family)
MNKLRLLEERVGGWWTGIKFHYGDAPEVKRKREPMRFCEALAGSQRSPIVLIPEIVNCPGALRSLGWGDRNDQDLASAMAEKAGMTPEIARGLIFSTPNLRTRPTAITVGACEEPDVAISFAQPEAVMRLLQRWQSVFGKTLLADISCVMAVCGSVAVRAYMTEQVCLSFGCPDSRNYGAINRDRLVIGLPTSLVEKLA